MDVLKPLRLIPILLLLAACTGTGVRDKSTFLQAAAGGDTIVVVERRMQYGGGSLLKVHLNGKKIGDLGLQESVSGKAVVGPNILTVGFGGISALTRDPDQRSFSMKPGQKRYFALGAGAFDVVGVRRIIFLEVTEDEFFQGYKH